MLSNNKFKCTCHDSIFENSTFPYQQYKDYITYIGDYIPNCGETFIHFTFVKNQDKLITHVFKRHFPNSLPTFNNGILCTKNGQKWPCIMMQH